MQRIGDTGSLVAENTPSRDCLESPRGTNVRPPERSKSSYFDLSTLRIPGRFAAETALQILSRQSLEGLFSEVRQGFTASSSPLAMVLRGGSNFRVALLSPLLV